MTNKLKIKKQFQNESPDKGGFMLKSFVNFKLCNNFTSSTSSCQEENLKELTDTQIVILDEILKLGNNFDLVFPCQRGLGRKAGVGIRQAHRIIKQLCQMGLLQKITTPFQSCYYQVNPMLLNPDVRRRWSHVFYAFRFLSLILLFSGLQSKNVVRRISDHRSFNTSVIGSLKREQKKGKVMALYKTDEQIEIINRLGKELKLTPLGHIKFRPYPFECIQYAYDKLKYARNVQNSTVWMLKLCNEWCKDNNITPDWAVCFKLYDYMKVDPLGPLNFSVIATDKPSMKREERPTGRKRFASPQRDQQESKATEYDFPAYREGLLNTQETEQMRSALKEPSYMAYQIELRNCRAAPAAFKEDWLKIEPALLSRGCRQALKEYIEGTVVPTEGETLLSSLGKAVTVKEQATRLSENKLLCQKESDGVTG
jgi:hypothetical protein